MSSKPPSTRETRPSTRLVVHDIRLVRERMPDGSEHVKALVDCEQQGCEVRANECAHCKRFVRIEPHEAGYVLLCHAKDQPCRTSAASEHAAGQGATASEPSNEREPGTSDK